jgi:DNA invertase Pin-like site-specific DNA recombinase
MNVAIYARVSTHDKDQNPETQLRPLRQHVAGLKGVSVLGEFIDKAGADDLRGRREWRRLLDLALSGKADLIVVWKLDRAFRSVVDGANTLQSLRSGGCGIRSLQELWIDTTTPIGEAMYHITIAWAQLEKRQLTERVKAGMERARAEGKSLGRPQRSRPVIEHPLWSRSAPSAPGTSTALRRHGSSECASRCSSMHWRRSQMRVVVLVARLNSSSGSVSPFPKDVLWERSWTRAIRRLETLLLVFIVVSGCRVS